MTHQMPLGRALNGSGDGGNLGRRFLYSVFPDVRQPRLHRFDHELGAHTLAYPDEAN
jgi:hypothetical protein